MPKISQMRVGTVYLKEVRGEKWRASWTDPLTKRHMRRILPASSFQEAKKQAKGINTDLAAQKGFGGRLRGSTGHSVADAVLEAVKHSDASERTRKHYLCLYNAFSDYLDANAKGVEAWGDVTEPIIENYIEHCRQENVSHDTLRLRIQVLRMTSDYMSRTYPDSYRHVTTRLRLKRFDSPKAELDEQETVLSAEQLRSLLDTLKKVDRMVYTWAILQGLCGFRMMEAAYLREDDLDLASETPTIRITETAAHKPKNRHSYRTIPICKAAKDVLAEWILGLKVRHGGGYLFAPSLHRSGLAGAKTVETRSGVYTQDTVKKKWRAALTAAKNRKREDGSNELILPERFVPRKLRATFVTLLRTAKVDFATLQVYIGHAPTTILSEHYDKVDLKRLSEIAMLAQSVLEKKSENEGESKESAKMVGNLH